MIEFKESKFYKLLQDFFINNNKETFLQMLAEFYNRTEGIIDKNKNQDELIKELRELYIEFNEKGIDENIVIEKVNYFVENNVKIKDILAKLVINTNKIEDNTEKIKDNTEKLNANTNSIENINSQLDTKANIKEVKYSFSPEMFGETGTEDDTIVIQKMFDYIYENNYDIGASVNFLNNKYTFGNVIIKTPNVTIKSGGVLDGTFTVQSVDTLNPNTFNLLSMNVVFDGVKFNSATRKNNAIIIKRLRDVTITNCSFENFEIAIYGDSESGFKWQRTARVKIIGNIFKKCGKCIYTYQTPNDDLDTLWTYMQHGDYMISNNYFYGTYDQISDTPIVLNGQDGAIIKNNFLFCGNRVIGRGLEINDSNFLIIEGNNFFETALEGMYLTKIRNVNISNNTFAWCGQKTPKKTIVIKGHTNYVSTRLNLSNNIIEKTSDSAIYIDGDVTRVKISNNIISGVGTNTNYFNPSLVPRECYDILVSTSSTVESETEYYNDVIINDNYGDKGVNCGRGYVFNNYNHNYLKNTTFFGNLKFGLAANGIVDFYQYKKLNVFNPSYPYIFKEWTGTISNIINANLNQIVVLIGGSNGLKVKNDSVGDGMIKTKAKADITLNAGESMTLMKTDTYWIEI